MALPATMNVLGLILDIALIVFVGVLTEFSVGMLLRFSKAGGGVSYGGNMGDAFGNVGRRTLEFVDGCFGEHWWNGHSFVVLVTILVVLAPLTSFKRMDSLRYIYALVVILAFDFLAITIRVTVFLKLVKGSNGMPRLLLDITDINSVSKLFTVVPIPVTYVYHFNGKAILHAPSYVTWTFP
ncbi:unnamed protein product [Fraxinus pennsylvanica]|uniref:Amino acid transporter transmembrane domain-containing protein n=1 Tax=Fraxinus pennsylvanica TaxID=56036 RepID=A0AAD2A768_9LAMI|nr:unnamed protein product [Fraxinus pennsylvanica]